MFNNGSSFSLVVGNGRNYFTMERGSFNYKEVISKKYKCKLINNFQQGDEKELAFVDNIGNTYRFSVQKEGSRIEIKLISDIPVGINRFWLTFKTDYKEHIYGCGENYSEYDLKGQRVRIWVAEHQNAKRIGKKLFREKIFGVNPNKKSAFGKYESYYVQPTFVSSNKYFVHVFTNSYSVFDFKKLGETTIYLQERPHIIMDSADSFRQLSENLSALLGRQKKLPDWIYDGGIIAAQDWKYDGEKTFPGFDGCSNVDRKIKAAKDAGAEIVGVWCQDWCGCRCTQFGYQVMWNWEYSKDQYPNLPEKILEWKLQGVRFLGYINPFMAIEKELYKYAHEKGYLVKDKNGEDYLVTITTFPAAMIDLTNPEAYEWYKSIIKKNMIGIGMGGWMADFGEYLPTDAVLFDGNAEELHNQWPAIWAKLNQEAIVEAGEEDEIFFFTRAGYTDTIKNSTMMWTGDQHVDFSYDDGIGSVIPATLSLALSGYGIAHSDVGGYTTMEHMTRSKELLLRWIEMNAFSPLFRCHEGNQPSRNVQFDYDEETKAHLAKYTNIHRGLKEYLKDCVEQAVAVGTPVIRPLFYHYDEEKAFTESTEYLLGRDILVAPVLDTGAKGREVYLPDDEWINVFSREEYVGGTYYISAPIGEIPVFIRKNSEEKIDEILFR